MPMVGSKPGFFKRIMGSRAPNIEQEASTSGGGGRQTVKSSAIKTSSLAAGHR